MKSLILTIVFLISIFIESEARIYRNLERFELSEQDRSRYEIRPDDKTNSLINENIFSKVIHRIESLYLNDFLEKGLIVNFNYDWEMSYFSAWAHDDAPPVYSLNFWGGMARIPGMNEYGWAFIVCHEVGHLLGGAPYNDIKFYLWASAEGQADYFASAHCLKRYFSNYPYKGIKINLAESVVKQCEGNFHCLNSAKAADSFSKVLNYLLRDKNEASIQKRSYNKVSKTIFSSYPSKQCRVDTILNAGLCDNDFHNLNSWDCLQGPGKRSECWFKN